VHDGNKIKVHASASSLSIQVNENLCNDFYSLSSHAILHFSQASEIFRFFKLTTGGRKESIGRLNMRKIYILFILFYLLIIYKINT